MPAKQWFSVSKVYADKLVSSLLSAPDLSYCEKQSCAKTQKIKTFDKFDLKPLHFLLWASLLVCALVAQAQSVINSGTFGDGDSNRPK
jgi:hypothetical protein